MPTLKLTKKYSTYPEHKDSGVEWLGRIPKDWDTLGAKRIFTEVVVKGDINLPLASVTQEQGVVLRSDSGLSVWNPWSDISGYKTVDIGDFVISLRSFEGGIEYSQVKGLVSPAYTVLRQKKDIYPQYYKWLLKSREYISALQINVRWIRDGKNISFQDFSKIDLPIISDTNIQKQIADYLDQKTVLIDQTIQKKQKQIELLREKRTAVINQAVTKGLDPNAPLVESGIEWIGKIPKGWRIEKLKFLAKSPLQYGANEAALDDDKTKPRFIRISDIDEKGNLREDTFKSLDVSIAQPYLLKDWDILFARTWGTVWKSFKYKKEWGVCCFAGYLIKMSVNEKKISSDYIEYITKSDYYWKWIDSIFIQSTIQNVSAEKYKEFLIILPPLEDQKLILEFLDAKMEKCNLALQKIENTIELLQEFKSSLISHVVTGKIKI